MEYFENEENVRAYIQMCEGYDGKELVDQLRNYLANGASVLELGMGPGTDLDLLANHYDVTGSDYSNVFLSLYHKKNPKAKLLQLDAVSIATEQTFDAIYSNKVLHHLSQEELQSSIQQQYARLNKHGIVLHTFWHGDKTETIKGMLFNYYTEVQLSKIFEPLFKILQIERYTELEEQDSTVLIAKKESIK